MTSPPSGTVTTMYASIRDQLANEITSGVYPTGALLPSIREIMQRWEVSTTTARRVLDELVVAGYARKERTRGHISTGEPSADTPPPAAREYPITPSGATPATPGRLTVRPVHTIPAEGSILPDTDTNLAAVDVRTERPSADAAVALRLTNPERPITVRRRLLTATDGTPVQYRVSYLPASLAEGTPLAEPQPIPEPWPAALATHLRRRLNLTASHITARHPHHDEATALALPTDAAALVREDIHHDENGTPVDYTRTVWPGDTTHLRLRG